MSRVKPVSMPSTGRVNTAAGSYQFITPVGGNAPPSVQQLDTAPTVRIAPEPGSRSEVDNDSWQAELRMREIAEGLDDRPVNVPLPPAPNARKLEDYPPPQRESHLSHRQMPDHDQMDWPRLPIEIADLTDLSGLPDSFAFHIERKGEKWKVTAPDIHVGLFVADENLSAALARAPGELSKIIAIDGLQPKPKARKRG